MYFLLIAGIFQLAMSVFGGACVDLRLLVKTSPRNIKKKEHTLNHSKQTNDNLYPQ